MQNSELVNHAVELLRVKLKSSLGRDVTVELTTPSVEIPTFAHSIEVQIQLGIYKHVQLINLADLQAYQLVDGAFQNVYSNFIYWFIKCAAQQA